MKYNHLYYKDYPSPFGHRWETDPLPKGMSIEIITEDGSKHVYVNSRIHMNKRVLLHPIYSTSFTDVEILKDISGKVYRRWIA